MNKKQQQQEGGLQKLKIAFSREYSTKRAVQIIYQFHTDMDEVMTADDEDAVITELLKDEAQENDHFFVEAVDWVIVRPTVVIMLSQFTERTRI